MSKFTTWTRLTVRPEDDFFPVDESPRSKAWTHIIRPLTRANGVKGTSLYPCLLWGRMSEVADNVYLVTSTYAGHVLALY